MAVPLKKDIWQSTTKATKKRRKKQFEPLESYFFNSVYFDTLSRNQWYKCANIILLLVSTSFQHVLRAKAGFVMAVDLEWKYFARRKKINCLFGHEQICLFLEASWLMAVLRLSEKTHFARTCLFLSTKCAARRTNELNCRDSSTVTKSHFAFPIFRVNILRQWKKTNNL